MAKIQRALISLSDKTGIVDFARGLSELGVEILSTGGTAKLLSENNIPVVEVGDYTGQPEILDGRLKTLHPKIHGGILAIRSNTKHIQEADSSGIGFIDVIVVNLYPFEQTIAKEGVSLEEAIENIDIGGPTMIRAAAKNWQDVVVVVDPADYAPVLAEIKKGQVSNDLKFKLALKVFALTSRYDGAIANYLTGGREKKMPGVFNYQGRKIQELRYGENPHQKAAFYTDAGASYDEPSVSGAKQRHGKELSYNNIMDLDGALEAVKEFTEPAVVVIKHATPSGVACAAGSNREPSLLDIFIKARDCDPVSAFGGIIAINEMVDVETATEISKDFYECVIAPGFSPGAFEVLAAKKNIRIMEIPGWSRANNFGKHASNLNFKKVTGGMLVQDRDLHQYKVRQSKVVSARMPGETEWQTLEFAWKVCKHVKSNAIVYAGEEGGILRTVGIGGGQVSRVDATKVGISKARSPIQGTVMASDAFFPFRDNIDEAAKAGVIAIIQPGGSLRDQESIEAVNERNIAMVFTGTRHFRH